MHFFTTMVVLPISRCARRFLGIHEVRRTRRRNPLARLEKNFPDGDPPPNPSKMTPVIDCVTLVQREASSVDSRASPRVTATPADSAAVPWSDD
jgi:hypothetical protein